MAKTAKLRPWTATEIRKLKGLAKKKVGAAKIARALKRTTRAVETRATSLVSRCTPDRIKGASLTGAHKNAATVVPVVNQIRTYWWCSPPRIGRQRMCPASSTAREIGASFSKDKCVRISL